MWLTMIPPVLSAVPYRTDAHLQNFPLVVGFHEILRLESMYFLAACATQHSIMQINSLLIVHVGAYILLVCHNDLFVFDIVARWRLALYRP